MWPVKNLEHFSNMAGCVSAYMPTECNFLNFLFKIFVSLWSDVVYPGCELSKAYSMVDFGSKIRIQAQETKSLSSLAYNIVYLLAPISVIWCCDS